MVRNVKADNLLALAAKTSTIIANGKDSRQARAEFAEELRKHGADGAGLADLLDPNVPGNH